MVPGYNIMVDNSNIFGSANKAWTSGLKPISRFWRSGWDPVEGKDYLLHGLNNGLTWPGRFLERGGNFVHCFPFAIELPSRNILSVGVVNQSCCGHMHISSSLDHTDVPLGCVGDAMSGLHHDNHLACITDIVIILCPAMRMWHGVLRCLEYLASLTDFCLLFVLGSLSTWISVWIFPCLVFPHRLSTHECLGCLATAAALCCWWGLFCTSALKTSAVWLHSAPSVVNGIKHLGMWPVRKML